MKKTIKPDDISHGPTQAVTGYTELSRRALEYSLQLESLLLGKKNTHETAPRCRNCGVICACRMTP